jgi:hypothetical protein
MYIELKKVLGDGPFFGGSRNSDPSYAPRVALVSTDKGGKRTVVMANYNRRDESWEGDLQSHSPTTPYDFPRPGNPKEELSIWEAAAASSATQPYFKPFFHSASGRYFLDGSLNNSNPVKIVQQERTLLWPDIKDRAPDLFLSIGTSQDKADIASSMQISSETRAK